MMCILYATQAAALAAIAARDVALGYPVSSDGIDVGGGRFVVSVVTSTCARPVPLSSGQWAVPAGALGTSVGAVAVSSSDVLVAQIGA